jgi:hypothetical protein
MAYEDHDLRRRFSALADEVRSAAPAFGRRRLDAHRTSLEARRARLARYSVGSLTTLAAAAVIAVALWSGDAEVSEPPISDWVAPTDFLLHTPGTNLLSSMPAASSSTDLEPTNAADVRRGTSGE